MNASILRELLVMAYNEGLNGTEVPVMRQAMDAITNGTTENLPVRITDDDSLIDLITKAITALNRCK